MQAPARKSTEQANGIARILSSGQPKYVAISTRADADAVISIGARFITSFIGRCMNLASIPLHVSLNLRMAALQSKTNYRLISAIYSRIFP